ncbi:MAG: 4Fe-4S dicluster domain-containing protein [Planctomycetaceae bacterium]
MNDSDEPTGELSRRDFVQGRFWRALRAKQTADHNSQEPPAGPPRPAGLVMRYPQTLADVTGPTPAANAAQPNNFSARRRTIPVLRPPGAIDEASFLAQCTRCNRCVEACPHDAIVHAPARLREAAGTPMLDPDRSPCRMCDDLPCITACEPNVLTSLVPVLMGTAKVTEHLCLAHHGTTCTVCSERCPVAGAIQLDQGKPTVDESACTGCGICRYVCPAPENAILLMPTFHRPELAHKSTT